MQGMLALHMRIGLSTGVMMVGDVEAPPRPPTTPSLATPSTSAHASRASTRSSTPVLVSSRTHEMVEELMLTGPIGRVVVVGRKGYEELTLR